MVSRNYGRLNELGETPLIAATRQGSATNMRRLLEGRADPDAPDSFGETALMEAASLGEAGLCKLLLQHGAEPAHKSPSGLSARDLAVEHPAVLALLERDWQQDWLRSLASRHDDEAMERAVAKHGTTLDFDASDGEGNTLLHACTASPPESRSAARFLGLLLDARALVDATNMLGETPLILAVRCSADSAVSATRLDLVRALLDRGATVNASDSVLHETSLMEASGIGDLDLVFLLLEARADASRPSASGQHALDFARAPGVRAVLEDPQRALEQRHRPLLPPKAKPSIKQRPGAKKESGPSRGTGLSPSSFPWRTQNDAGEWSTAAPPPKQAQHAPGFPPPKQAQHAPGFFGMPRPPPQPSTPKQPPSAEDRLKQLHEMFPGFAGSGVDLPSDFLAWTKQEQELFVGSLGQLWPPGKRSRQHCGGSGHTSARLPASQLRKHFRILEIPETTTDAGTLKRAYRLAALKWHPDKNPGDRVGAAQKFQEVACAYDELRRALGL